MSTQAKVFWESGSELIVRLADVQLACLAGIGFTELHIILRGQASPSVCRCTGPNAEQTAREMYFRLVAALEMPA